jgi:hypothetical protein
MLGNSLAGGGHSGIQQAKTQELHGLQKYSRFLLCPAREISKVSAL